MIDLVGGVVERTQQLVDRSFFVSAFLPVVVTAATTLALVRGPATTARDLTALVDGSLSDAVVVSAAIFLLLYLIAFVVHGLRRSIRELWAGGLPLRPVREALVMRQARRRESLILEQKRLYQDMTVARWADSWLKDSTTKPAFVPDTPEEADAVDALATRVQSLVESRAPWWSFRQVEDTVELSTELLRLVRATTTNPRHGGVVQAARGALATPQGRQRVHGAAVCIDQRVRHVDQLLATRFPPQPYGVRGSALGNVMAWTNQYSHTRYGIPLQTLWPRLKVVSDDEALVAVDDALVRVDFALAMTTGFGVVVMVALGNIVVAGAGGDVATADLEWLAWLLLAGALAMAMYRFAVASAVIYAGEICAIVDLFQQDVRSKIDLGDIAAARAEWDAIHLFVEREPDEGGRGQG